MKWATVVMIAIDVAVAGLSMLAGIVLLFPSAVSEGIPADVKGPAVLAASVVVGAALLNITALLWEHRPTSTERKVRDLEAQLRRAELLKRLAEMEARRLVHEKTAMVGESGPVRERATLKSVRDSAVLDDQAREDWSAVA